MSKQPKEDTSVSKTPKTIKVSTVIIAIIILAALIASFIAGWTCNGLDQDRVNHAAQALQSKPVVEK